MARNSLAYADPTAYQALANIDNTVRPRLQLLPPLPATSRRGVLAKLLSVCQGRGDFAGVAKVQEALRRLGNSGDLPGRCAMNGCPVRFHDGVDRPCAIHADIGGNI